jgi:hypothetical protein
MWWTDFSCDEPASRIQELAEAMTSSCCDSLRVGMDEEIRPSLAFRSSSESEIHL